MYKIEKKGFGFKLTFAGSISAQEMAEWLEDARQAVAGQQGPFYVFVDMRTLIPLSREAQVHMDEGQRLYRQAGMVRSVVIINSPVTEAQFRRIGGQTGIARGERYINAIETPNWEQVGLDWLLKEVDPEVRRKMMASS